MNPAHDAESGTNGPQRLRLNAAQRANLVDNNYHFLLKHIDPGGGGDVASLPQAHAAVATQNGNSPGWDNSTANG